MATEGATLETTAHEFAWRRAIRARSTKDPSVPFTIPMSGMIEPRPDLRRAGEG